MCDKDPNCLNSRKIVLDTNFLDQINRTIKEDIAFYMLGKTIDEQRRRFVEEFKKILGCVEKCGSGQLFTSEKVYNDEIDIKKSDSDLRKADMNFINGLCREEEFSNSLSTIYQEKINIEKLDEEEVRRFKRLLTVNVSLADASLVFLGLHQSQNNEVIIVTDDLALRKVIEDLRKEKEVTIMTKKLITENLHFFGTLHFLKSLHSCCEVSDLIWMAALYSFWRHQQRRLKDGRISEDIFKEHDQYATLCFGRLSSEIDAKKQGGEIN